VENVSKNIMAHPCGGSARYFLSAYIAAKHLSAFGEAQDEPTKWVLTGINGKFRRQDFSIATNWITFNIKFST
jgi:hypothetical protein